MARRCMLFILSVLLLAACGSSPEAAAPTASSTPAASATPAPTNTPEATATPKPTSTPKPTKTPEPTATPKAEKPKVIKSGFGQDGRWVGWGFAVQSFYHGVGLQQSQYQIGFYDAEGNVIKTDSGYIFMMLPGEIISIGGNTVVDEGVEVAKMDVQFRPGKEEKMEMESQPAGIFKAEKAAYAPGTFGSKVTGIINNPLKTDVTKLQVSALVYDAENNIIGGGFTYLDFVPTGGQSPVEVSVYHTAGVEPVSVELYAIFTILSDV